MADTVKKIIEIEAKYQTLAELKTALAEARLEQVKVDQAVKDGNATYDEQEKALVNLKAAQNEYNTAQRIAVKEVKAVKGSYNDLVNQLARLKEQWKQAVPNTDEYTRLTEEVNKVKTELADMDHAIGNWQSNVGNYAMAASSSLGTFGEALEKSRTATTSLSGAVKNTGAALKLLSTNPVMAIAQLFLPLIIKITSALKENNTVIEAGQRTMDALKPVLNALSKGIETIAGWISKAADYFVELLAQSDGTFGKIISGAAGVGNAILQYMLTPIRAAVAAFKGVGKIVQDVFKGQFGSIKDDARVMGEEIGAAFQQGFSFKANFQTGKATGAQFVQGIKAGATETTEESGEASVVEKALGFDDAKFAKTLTKINDKLEAALERINEKANDAAAKALAEQEKSDMDEINAFLEESYKQDVENYKAAQEAKKKANQSYMSALNAVTGAVISIMNSEIDAKVKSGEMTEEQAKKEFEAVKAFQYAQTWINTLASVIGAFSDPTPMPFLAKAANAATAMATGIASTVQIANTSYGSTGAAGAGAPTVQTAAPAVPLTVPEYRTLTSASDEMALNQRFADQRVVLVTSELEAHNRGRAVQLQEATF